MMKTSGEDESRATNRTNAKTAIATTDRQVDRHSAFEPIDRLIVDYLISCDSQEMCSQVVRLTESFVEFPVDKEIHYSNERLIAISG